MLATTALAIEAAPQKSGKVAHRQQADTTAIDVFSDTTSIDSSSAAAADTTAATPNNFTVNIGGSGLNDMLDSMGETPEYMFVLSILIILFVLCPMAIITLICYFIYRFRKQRLQLAEMAMRNGQPIPEDTKPKRVETADDYWRSGVRNVAVGLGLAVLFYCVFGFGVFVGIGLFVAIYGAGQMVIARTTAQKKSGDNATETATDITEKDF